MIPRLCASLLAGLAACAAAQGPDPLQACWRGQQTRVTAADSSFHDQNADCVLQITGDRVRGVCDGSNGRTETLSGYQRLAPDRLRVTMLDPATGAPKGPSSELHYRIDDDWLRIERPVMGGPAAPTGPKQPVSLSSVSMRVPADARCEPRGDTGLRIGRTPRSSLVLAVPEGWQPLLVDPSQDASLAEAVNANLLVGLFGPRPPVAGGPARFVIVLDDVRSGPVPVRAAEFAAVKKRFSTERGGAKITCDEPDRICGWVQPPGRAIVYGELVNVSGRVAMVHAAGSGGLEDLPGLQRAVAPFVAALRKASKR